MWRGSVARPSLQLQNPSRMCGILVYSKSSEKTKSLRPLIEKRGPDHYGQIFSRYTFESSVLSLREPFTKQPLQLDNKLLCFNGQIYNTEGNDTAWVFEQLLAHGPQYPFLGEYAFVYYDGNDIWFKRDSVGTRSLLYYIGEDDEFIISSIGLTGFIECQAGTLYKWDGRKLLEVSTSPIVRVERIGETSSVSSFIQLLQSSVASRMVMPKSENSIAVLFSGGLDCTLLACLMDKCLPQHIRIELLNVAFENKRTNAKFDTPDRKLAIRSHAELTALSKRDIDLIKIDVPYEEATSYYPLVTKLMYPKHTVMDLSIALAFFCASKASRESNSKILLSGLGADELFGGYSRHTRAAEQGSEALATELELDFNRLGSRNLGRDDRVCCYWGKEVRYPFLDAAVVEYAVNVDISVKASAIDTKILLRQAARELGLNAVSTEKKRAIQFGAKSAKMDPDSGRAKGTDLL